jgi:hypothetical protein
MLSHWRAHDPGLLLELAARDDGDVVGDVLAEYRAADGRGVANAGNALSPQAMKRNAPYPLRCCQRNPETFVNVQFRRRGQ